MAALWADPAGAARPLLDKGQWDAYFALFARDAYVPWKPTVVRLDTYSGAPVDFAAYAVDPAEVIIAGQNRRPRALDTKGLKPVVHWRFSPPAGYSFESNDVTVPLGAREGFFVVEARRGDAVQQVWLNRTHIGLVTKESPESLVLWAVDLRSGHGLAGITVSFLSGLTLQSTKTDAHGLIVWSGGPRPSFALAEDGAGRAFVSILPQAPLPPAIVGIRLESASVRAGSAVRLAGFARRRAGGTYRRASGEVHLSLAGRGHMLASVTARLDAAGAFTAELPVPALADAGEYAVLASAAGAVGGTSVHVDAAGDLTLGVRSTCPCDPNREVPIELFARRGGEGVAQVPIRVQVVRTPHIVPPGAADDAPRWGTTIVYERTVVTDEQGGARIAIAQPTDGLDSTYSLRATAKGATATSRITVANARIALAVESDAPSADVGQPIAFDVRGFDPADGSPAAGLVVTLRATHGATAQEQSVILDERGRAHAVFKTPSLGSNLIVAEAQVDGRRALDATAVLVEPSALSGAVEAGGEVVKIATDKARYRPGDRVLVRATAPGSSGDALVTLEGAKTYQVRVVSGVHGQAAATLDLGEVLGDVRVGAAVVRDGSVALATAPVEVDGPGHARATELTLDKASYEDGETLHAEIHDGGIAGEATFAIRIADGRESAPAFFDDAPQVLSIGGTSSQNPAAERPTWHAYVTPAHSKANDIFAAERPRKAPTEPPSIGVAAPRTLYWQVVRHAGEAIDVPVPKERGHFVLSILKISDEGDVGAASASFNVE